MEYNSNGITLEVKHNSVTKFVELCNIEKEKFSSKCFLQNVTWKVV